jgi:hypothetical protein
LNDRRGPLPVRVVLPWWEDALHDASESGVEPSLPAMQWLVGRAAQRQPVTNRWRDWLLASAGLGEHVGGSFPAGPTVRAAFQAATPHGLWAVAQPVHLATAIDHLRLAALQDLGVSAEESAALLATINGHLAGTGFVLSANSPDLWSLQCAEPIECNTFEPAQVVGRSVRDYMPAGRDGPAIRSLMNEIQMLLHEHPVNERRTRGGRPAINSLWVWGFGSVAPPAPARLPMLATDDAWLTGIWRMHGASALPAAAAVTQFEKPVEGALVALTQPGGRSHEAALTEIDVTLLDAARDAVATGRCRSLEVCTGGTVTVMDARSRWRFWRRPAAPAEFLP